jgi:hypothetical protein
VGISKISVTLPSANFMAVQIKILSARFLKDAFKLETFLFGSLRSNWGYFLFSTSKKKFRRVALIRIFGSFFTFKWNIYQFYCFWAWFDVKFYADLKKIYVMRSKVQSKVFGAKNGIHRSEILCWAQKSILYESWELKNVKFK